MDPFEYLASRGHFNIRPGLERIDRVMTHFEDPHLSIPAVHIGGTNGKGSTTEMVRSILGSFPLRIGTYTSPHLERITERMRIDGVEIDMDELGQIMVSILTSEEEHGNEGELTYFELLTAASFLWMEKQKVDVNICEVGMGGRWDATNILEPQAVAITSISMDHMEHLGDDPISISSEKCGIIKPSTPTVVGEVCSLLEERERCLRTILDTCTHNGCPVILISDIDRVREKEALLSSYNIPDWRIVSVEVESEEGGITADLKVHGPDIKRQQEPKFDLVDSVMNGVFRAPLSGKHQAYNLGISIALSLLVLPFGIAHSKLRNGDRTELTNLIKGCVDSLIDDYTCDEISRRIDNGIQRISLKGRLERVVHQDKRIYIDGGHNIEAARKTSEYIHEIHQGTPVHLLFSMMGDKEASEFLYELDMDPESVVLTRLPYERGMSVGKQLKGLVASGSDAREVHLREELDEAIDLWISRIGEDGLGLATGSFYLYGPIKKHLGLRK